MPATQIKVKSMTMPEIKIKAKATKRSEIDYGLYFLTINIFSSYAIKQLPIPSLFM